MTTSSAGRKLIESSEGCPLTAYQDQAGVWTIGYGHTGYMGGVPIAAGDKCTQWQAEQMLLDDLHVAESAVNRLVRVALNQNQFDALVSFTFNLGVAALQSSHLLAKLNACDYAGAANQFPLWDHAGGWKDEGLRTRRDSERELFLTAV